jgi:AcrR family transcriptional regulator
MRAGGPLDSDMILSATEEVLRRHGPAKATVVDVGRALGVSHAAVYKHFPSKTALREAVSRRWLNRDLEALAAIVGNREISPRQRLRTWLATLLALKTAKVHDDPELFAAFRILVTENSDAAVEHVAGLLLQLETVIADGIATGAFGHADPAELARTVFTATNRFHHPVHANEWQLPGIEDDLDAVCTLLLDGLTTR